VTTNGPVSDPEYLDSETVVAFVNGPDGLGGADDNHLIAVNTANGTSWRVTPTDDQVTSFSVRPCAGTVIYTSAGKLRGYGDQPVYERDGTGDTPSRQVGEFLAGDVFAGRNDLRHSGASSASTPSKVAPPTTTTTSAQIR
jgi:uncharacterized protein YgiB involved in biofilm formation